MTLLAPYNETTMKQVMEFVKDYEHPSAFRYPRGTFMADDCESLPFELGKSQLIQEGRDILFIGYGNGVGRAIETAKLFDNATPAILDLRFVKPLDEDMLRELSHSYKKWFIFSDSVRLGGVGSAILEFLSQESIVDVDMTTFEYDDAFITHGNTKLIEESLGVLPKQLVKKILDRLGYSKGINTQIAL
jgi:1-deoxy-D-xylulose-5-phosphate synthase